MQTLLVIWNIFLFLGCNFAALILGGLSQSPKVMDRIPGFAFFVIMSWIIFAILFIATNWGR